jgi:acetylornithine deacetylase/succinyl-diaminopimelate desuccinylase-like protein
VLEDLRGHFAACDLPVEVENEIWSESGETAPGERIVKLAQAAHAREFNTPAPLIGEPAATDGWWFTNRAGIPAVMAFGPGETEDAHAVDESVDVDLLQRYARAYADVIASFLEPSEGG